MAQESSAPTLAELAAVAGGPLAAAAAAVLGNEAAVAGFASSI